MPIWNPFRKRSEAAMPASDGDSAPGDVDNRDLIAAIHAMKRDTLMGDMRPMHRAILRSPLLLPLHEPAQATPEGTRLRYLTFDEDATLVAFSDMAHFRAFLGDWVPRLYMAQVTGQELCRMAGAAHLGLLAINPQSGEHYAMPPLVYNVLAQGFVPSSVTDERVREERATIAPAISGAPDAEMLGLWREIFQRNQVARAFWFNLVLLEAQELRYAWAVDCPEEQLRALQHELVAAWFGRWPVNTPLWVQPLGDDGASKTIREVALPLFP